MRNINKTNKILEMPCYTFYMALYFSGYFIMTWVSLSKWNGLVNGLRHFFWLCTWENGHDLGKQQQDIWIWYIFLSLWGPFVLVQAPVFLSAFHYDRRNFSQSDWVSTPLHLWEPMRVQPCGWGVKIVDPAWLAITCFSSSFHLLWQTNN